MEHQFSHRQHTHSVELQCSHSHSVEHQFSHSHSVEHQFSHSHNVEHQCSHSQCGTSVFTQPVWNISVHTATVWNISVHTATVWNISVHTATVWNISVHTASVEHQCSHSHSVEHQCLYSHNAIRDPPGDCRPQPPPATYPVHKPPGKALWQVSPQHKQLTLLHVNTRYSGLRLQRKALTEGPASLSPHASVGLVHPVPCGRCSSVCMCHRPL